MINWLRPPKRSASVSFPRGPSNTYCFSTFSHGSSRRCLLSSSRSRVNSFSLSKCCLRAASHSVCDTILGFIFVPLRFGALVRGALVHGSLIEGPLVHGSLIRGPFVHEYSGRLEHETSAGRASPIRPSRLTRRQAAPRC